MKTVDIHTHLLNPDVRFDRLFDKLSVSFFAKKLGVEIEQLKTNPFTTYVSALVGALRESRHVEKACLFGVDGRLDEKGEEIDRDRTVCAMTEDVLKVANRHPDVFIPFLSLNPRRKDALDRIDEYVERGCRGAKFLQNYWGIDLNSPRFIPYYEKLQAHKIPLIIHIGSEYTIQSDPRYENTDMLELPLACGVTVIAAHMGLGRIEHKVLFWRNLSKNPRFFDADYFKLLEKLETYENLYADISAILVPMRARALRHLSEQKALHRKILFGTDYPVPFTIQLNTYDLAWSTRHRINRIANPFDRYAAAVLEYFPPDSLIYDNYLKVLPAA